MIITLFKQILGNKGKEKLKHNKTTESITSFKKEILTFLELNHVVLRFLKFCLEMFCLIVVKEASFKVKLHKLSKFSDRRICKTRN